MKFSWGKAIFLVMTAFVLLMASFMYRAAFNQEELVAENYYEQEIKYQQQIDKLNRTGALGEAVSLGMVGRRLAMINKGIKKQLGKLAFPFTALVRANLSTRPVAPENVMREGEGGVAGVFVRQRHENRVFGEVLYANHDIHMTGLRTRERAAQVYTPPIKQTPNGQRVELPRRRGKRSVNTIARGTVPHD